MKFTEMIQVLTSRIDARSKLPHWNYNTLAFRDGKIVYLRGEVVSTREGCDRISQEAQNSDEWVIVKPGTDPNDSTSTENDPFFEEEDEEEEEEETSPLNPTEPSPASGPQPPPVDEVGSFETYLSPQLLKLLKAFDTKNFKKVKITVR